MVGEVIVAIVGCVFFLGLLVVAYPELWFLFVREPPASREDRRTEKGSPLEERIGRLGVARSPLKLSGSVVLDGMADMVFEAVSEGEMISNGSQVVVVAVADGQLVVRLHEEDS